MTRRAAEFRPPDLGEPGGIVSFYQVRRLVEENNREPLVIDGCGLLVAHDDDRDRYAFVAENRRRGAPSGHSAVVAEYTPGMLYLTRRSSLWHLAARFRINGGSCEMQTQGCVWTAIPGAAEPCRIAVDAGGFALDERFTQLGPLCREVDGRPPFVCRAVGINLPPVTPTTSPNVWSEWFTEAASPSPTPQANATAQAARDAMNAARAYEADWLPRFYRPVRNRPNNNAANNRSGNRRTDSNG